MKRAFAIMILIVTALSSASCRQVQDVPVPSAPAGTEAEAFAPADTPAPTDTLAPSIAPEETYAPLPIHLKEGDSSELVIEIQKRLMDLNYIDSDEPSDHFTQSTTEAVKRFQRRNGLEVTGCIEDKDYSILMSSRTLTYTPGPGDEGEDISSLQERLYELGYLDSFTGVFDEATEAAVRLFQEKNLLEVDGMLNDETAEHLYYDNIVPNSPELGTQSDEILEYQLTLYELGYLLAEPNGFYGEETVSAVKRFQLRNGLIVDGYIGPTTAACLTSGGARFNTIEYTMSGEDVMQLQARLAELNYLKEQDITGYYGLITENAVRSFQISNGLGEDGRVDKHTRELLFSGNARAASAPGPDQPMQTIRPTPAPTNTPRPTPYPTRRPRVTYPPASPVVPVYPAAGKVRELIDTAAGKIGCPYVRGAGGPDRFDCSGFVYWCLNRVGVKVSYMSSYKWRTTELFPRINSFDEIQAGDIIVFRMDEYRGHVAIAVGEGKMIDASSTTGRVVCRSFNTSYWRRVFYCAYRIFGN